MDERRRKRLEEEFASLSPEQIKHLKDITKPVAEMLSQLKRSLEPKIIEAAKIGRDTMELLKNVAQAALEMQEALTQLGVTSGSITDAVELFPEEARGAAFHVLFLARLHLETGLTLKDYADAIRPDLTVREDFLFRGELEQALQEAAEDIADYNRAIKEETEVKGTPPNSRADKLQQAQKAREKALAIGAVMSINNHLAAPSAKEISQLFTPNNVFRFKDFGKCEGRLDEFGQLTEQGENTRAVLEPLDKVHTAFMMFIFQMASFNYDPTSPDKQDDNITFYIPKIIKELGLDARKGYSTRRSKEDLKQQRRERLVELLTPFNELLAKLPNGNVYQVCTISSYEPETELMTLHIPYFYRLIEYIAQQKYKDKAINKLFHSTVANEPNTAAVELAARILAGVKQRGLHKDNASMQIGTLLTRTTKQRGKSKTVVEVFAAGEQTLEEKAKEPRISYSIKWKTLFSECPQLENRLFEIMTSDKENKAMYYNKAIKDTVAAAYRIIMEKSDAKEYYLDFRIDPINDKGIIPPTKSTLDNFLIVSHKGKNPKYTGE